jgi:hypothetical protein
MSLLREIQADATNNDVPLETLLRKCRILASRLKNDEFKDWIQSELDGYRNGKELPDYRKMHGHCFGHFSGPFGSGLKNAPIPERNIPDDVRDMLTHIQMRNGIGAIEHLLQSEGGNLHYPWPADTSAMFGSQIYQNMQMMQAWTDVPKNFIAGILSTVRNRVLNFALEIEAQNPEAGEAPAGSTPIPQSHVSQIFNTYVYGNAGNVASGNGNQQIVNFTINQGDLKALEKCLTEQGVEKDDVEDLKTAIKSEPDLAGESFGPKVSSWIGKMISKTVDGTWKIGTTVAANLLTTVIKSYYGEVT